MLINPLITIYLTVRLLVVILLLTVIQRIFAAILPLHRYKTITATLCDALDSIGKGEPNRDLAPRFIIAALTIRRTVESA
jgi:hypothetical protein